MQGSEAGLSSQPTLPQPKLAVIIPTLGEILCLPEVLERVRRVLSSLKISFEILVVDDDSRDGTERFVAAIGAEDPRIRLLVRRGQRGLAGAILHGWQHTDATLLAVMDSDLQHPPELLRDLLAAIESGCDLAIASRYAGAVKQSCQGLRRWISALFIWMARPLQNNAIRVQDPLSGYFMIRRHCIANIAFRSSGFKLLLEILTRGQIGSLKEIPFVFGRRRAGRSKAGLKVAFQYFQLLAYLYLTHLRDLRLPSSTRRNNQRTECPARR